MAGLTGTRAREATARGAVGHEGIARGIFVPASPRKRRVRVPRPRACRPVSPSRPQARTLPRRAFSALDRSERTDHHESRELARRGVRETRNAISARSSDRSRTHTRASLGHRVSHHQPRIRAGAPREASPRDPREASRNQRSVRSGLDHRAADLRRGRRAAEPSDLPREPRQHARAAALRVPVRRVCHRQPVPGEPRAFAQPRVYEPRGEPRARLGRQPAHRHPLLRGVQEVPPRAPHVPGPR